MSRIGPPLIALLTCACVTRSSAPPVPEAPVPSETVARPPAPVDERGSAWVERALGSLSLREKAGQMVMAWSTGEHDPASDEFARLQRWVAEDGVGGIIISIGSPASYAARIDALQRRARVPLLVVTDMESGPGMRLSGPGGGTAVPPVMAVAATGSDSLAFQVGRVIGREGRAVGLGLNLAPVLDVNSNPANPIINVRSFGEDPALVARMGAAYVRGLHEGGLLAAAKHFPGHGDTHADSHMELPTVDAPRARLDSVELAPFRAVVASGIDAVLVGHIAVPALAGPQPPPASLSPRVVTGLLRGEMGFRGVVFTDAMNMGGVTRRYGQDEAALLAVEAGADILLQPLDPAAAVRALVRAVETGRIPAARIDQSVRRILAAKERAGLAASGGRIDREALARLVRAPEHARVAEEVARRSLTLVRDRRGLVPLGGGGAAPRVLSVTYADEGSDRSGRAFDRELAAGGARVSSARVGEGTTAAQFAALARRAEGVDVVVVSAYVQPREYRGSVDAVGGFAGFVEAMAGRGVPVVAVSFGSPYLLRSFPSVPAYLAAWGGADVSQRAAARALLGRAPITGRLPVSIPPEHPVGTGIVRGAPSER